MGTSQRDVTLDFLKSLGMVLIIIAHSNPPKWFFEFRTFDVPLLVFISASTFSLSSTKGKLTLKGYFSYLLKRFKRLIIPTWWFLIFYFVIFEIIDLVTQNKIINFSLSEILSSFLMLSGFGFVWIIRVYFLIAIVAPILNLIINNKIKGYLIVFFFFLINYLLFYVLHFSNYFINFFITEYIMYITGYGFIFASGLLFYRMTKREVLINNLIIFIILFSYFVITKNFEIQFMKYPPRMIYLIYGLLMSNIFVLLSKTSNIANFSRNKIIYYFSKYSLDIYFIHIFPVQLLFYKVLKISKNDFILRFLFIFVVTIVFSFIYIKYKTKRIRFKRER